jgi:hypothetical protein
LTTSAASENTFAGTEPSLGGVSRNPALTLVPEASTSTAAAPGDRYLGSSWLGYHALHSSDSSPDADRNQEGSAPRARAERIVGLKKWEGRVLEISDGLLTVELSPSDHEGPELVADFDLELLGPDSSFAGPGDIIYLTTRTIRNAAGYPYQTSSLKLRRPGPWSEDELREIQDIAKRQAELFKGMY